MKLFKQDSRLADVVYKNYLLLPVLTRFDIQLGVGDKTVKQICEDKGIDLQFFLHIINVYSFEDYFPEISSMEYSPKPIIEYLRKSHKFYVDDALQRLKDSLDKLVASANEKNNLSTLVSFFNTYVNELVSHVTLEEEKLFPYIKALINSEDTDGFNYSIDAYQNEHSDVESKVGDLKSLLVKYVQPDYGVMEGVEFLTRLFRFEKDLNDHSRIEELVLIPMVRQIERSKKNEH